MATSRSLTIPSYREDDLAAAGAKMLSRSVQRMSAKFIKSALAPLGGQKPNKPKSTKSVHFEAHLESVCYFKKDEQPCLIAARISAVKRTNGVYNPLKALTKDSPPLLHDSACVRDIISQSANRPADTPVRVEQVYISDQKNLTGTLSIANISFAQHVKVRFTLDDWKTASETAAEPFDSHSSKGFEKFGFTISLDDEQALKNKTMSFCVCYAVNGKEIMNNDDAMKYQIELSKLASQASKATAIETTDDSSSPLPSAPGTLKSGLPQRSPPGILRPSTSNSKLKSSLPSGNSLFGSFSRQSKTETETPERREPAPAVSIQSILPIGNLQCSYIVHQNTPLWKYMDRLSNSATTLSSRQIRLL